MMEALSSSITSILTRATGVTSQKMAFFRSMVNLALSKHAIWCIIWYSSLHSKETAICTGNENFYRQAHKIKLLSWLAIDILINVLNLPVALGPGVYSASNRNEYQKHKNNVSGE
jgi:hypothetical protein